jgi:hypothetical protein
MDSPIGNALLSRVLRDDRSRLQVVAPYIKDGTVLFPRTGCEQLLGQMFNLGVETHDERRCDQTNLAKVVPVQNVSSRLYESGYESRAHTSQPK